MTIEASPESASDEELVDAVREGTTSAYGELYARHHEAAQAFALRLTQSPAESDDCVAGAFVNVLETIRDGGGPDGAFRPYLLRAVRNHVYTGARHRRRAEPSDDLERLDGGEALDDPVVAELERSLVVRAFRTLPERWQTTLWHTAVEGQPPHEVAVILGTTPNAVTSLAYRAREGLRQAYLDCYLADRPESPCARQVRRLSRYVRGGLGVRASRATRHHLASCPACASLERELVELSTSMRAVVGPVAVGASLAGYLVDRGVGPVASWTPAPADVTPTWVGWGTRIAGVGLATLAVVPFALDVREPPRAVPPDVIRTPDPAAPAAPEAAPVPTRRPPDLTVRPTAPSVTAVARPVARPHRPSPNEAVGDRPSRPAAVAPPRTPDAPTAPPSARPAAAPEVRIAIGDPVEESARTLVPLTVVNRTGTDGTASVDLVLPEMMHLDVSADGPCEVTGEGRTARLGCGTVADGGTRDVVVALLPDDNGDGTISEQEGDLHASARVDRTRAEASRFVRVTC